MKSNLSRWGLSRYYITKEGILYFKTLNKGWVKKPLLEAIKSKYLCLHDWEVLHKTEYVTYWEILLKCKKCGKLRKKRV